MYPGTQVWRVDAARADQVPWTISALSLSEGETNVSAVLRREIGDRVERVRVLVDTMIAEYAAEAPDGTVASPLEPSDVIVFPADWSGPPARWTVAAVVVQGEDVRLVLTNLRPVFEGSAEQDTERGG